MKVKDYVHDMILNQKWAVELDQVGETDVDFYEYDQFWKHCPFLNCDVKYFRIWKNVLVLVIDSPNKID